MPFAAGPDPSGQILIPENLGYINEDEGLTVDALLARADLLTIVRDAMAVGFYHPASVPPSHLEALIDGLSQQGYQFADLRNSSLTVTYDYEPSVGTKAAMAWRIEPGLTLLEIQRLALQGIPFGGATGGLVVALAAAGLAAGLFLVRLRAQWRPVDDSHQSRVETQDLGPGRRVPLVIVGLLILAFPVAARLTLLQPTPPQSVQRVTAASPPPVMAQVIESGDWEISTYFTAVEKFYAGSPETLRGCPQIDCVDGTDVLGRFPSDFIAAVKEEGSGRIAHPVGTANFLNWSIDVGYWLDDAPRDAQGSILEPYTSVAADPDIAYVTSVEIKACGADAITTDDLDLGACELVRSKTWIVRDRFTGGEVGKHLDLYVGEQDRVDFGAKSPRSIHAVDAIVALRPYPATP